MDTGTGIPIGQTLSSLSPPVHTVQAAFTAHGVPWDKFFIVNAVTFKVRIIYIFYNVIAGRLALARQRLILSRHGFL